MPTRLSKHTAALVLVLSAALLTGCPNNASEPPPPSPTVPTSKLSETPGAPMVMEEVQEESANTATTVPAVDPVVVDPAPTPPRFAGDTFPFGTADNKTGDSDSGNNVYGSGGKVRNIAFVIDASGSMQPVLPFVINEVTRVIGELEAVQNITLIVFSGRGVYEAPGGGGIKGLRSATPEFRQELEQWLDPDNKQYQTGATAGKHAEKAILRALSYKPQAIYLISDNLTSGGDGNSKHELFQHNLMKSIHEANDADKPTKFHTIQMLYPDPLVRAGLRGTLQLLAEETGGTYKFISEEDLNLR